MQVFLIAALVGVVSYAIFLLLFPKDRDAAGHTKHALRRIMEETQNLEHKQAAETSIIRDESFDSPLLKLIALLPSGGSFASLILKAGFGHNAGAIIIALLALILIFSYIAVKMSFGPLGVLGSVAAGYVLVRKFLQSRIQKRNDAFINMFPDVLDMIVRSVRSGFPLNTAMKMVAENMDPPVSTEFQQVRDELALGRPLDEALARLSRRVDEPDVNFFVVVLSVQHETGGNLAEIISNLSDIIRKRKQLRMKIKAMTSEGRMTAWILGMLPILVFGAIKYITPDYLDPLFETKSGHMILGAALGLIFLTFWVIRQMIDIDI